MCHRLLHVVDVVLNAVDVTPDNPFEFAAPQFGVRVEELPALNLEDFFQPNVTAIINQIRAESANSMTMVELPLAMVVLSSNVLRQLQSASNSIGNQTRIATVVYATDALFQQRTSPTGRDSLQQVGSIIVDISLRRNGEVKNVEGPANGNIVRSLFMKTEVSRAVHTI